MIYGKNLRTDLTFVALTIALGAAAPFIAKGCDNYMRGDEQRQVYQTPSEDDMVFTDVERQLSLRPMDE